ncbi:MAG: homoserine dehydrogenase, partial [Planctomycetota bacterium]
MSENPYRVGMIGYGTVGRGVAQLLHELADLYAARLGRPLELRAVLVRDRARAVVAGLDEEMVTDDPEAFFAHDVETVIEVAGGRDPVGGYVRRALKKRAHVVTANKALLAAEGPELFGLARQRGVTIAFEASCGGGIPCVTALTAGLMANRIGGLYGILNGTCNYILTEMARRGKTYAEALAEAKDRGYAE